VGAELRSHHPVGRRNIGETRVAADRRRRSFGELPDHPRLCRTRADHGRAVDAHLDYRDDAGGVRYGHGNVLRRVRELPFVEQVVALGIRSLRTRREDREAHAQDGNVLVPAWDIHTKGPDGISDLLPRNRNVYVTFDIDAFDPGIAPGTGTPEVGGLSFEQARRLLELVITGNRLVGFDLVEVNPSLDVSQITALLGLQIMVEAAGFVFER
jgi:agmatinase